MLVMKNRSVSLTGHCLVKNEDRFLWFALKSVLPYLSKLIVYDTGSTDHTVEIIHSLKSPKIEFVEKGSVTPAEISALRQEQLDKTTTPFFMLVDGDEIWPHKSLETILSHLQQLPAEKLAIYCRTRNAIGDIYHYLPESTGKYRFQNRLGHYNMRFFRKLPDLKVKGIYPNESYDYRGRSLNEMDDFLEFVDVWYLHATNLSRSSQNIQVFNRNKWRRIETGNFLSENDLPEVFKETFPDVVVSSLSKRTNLYDATAKMASLVKNFRRRLHV